MGKENRLQKQYLRLYCAYGEGVVFLSMTDIADKIICTPRYARSLLNEMSSRGWLTWLSTPGRGSAGQLQCIYSADELAMVSENHLSIRKDIYNNRSNLFVYTPMPIGDLSPSLRSGRAERHLIRMVHSGLLRYRNNNLAPDISHYWESSTCGYFWYFFVRNDLVWHNGDEVNIEQIINQLNKGIRAEELGGMCDFILSLSKHNSSCVKVTLAKPNPLLPYLLANPVLYISHPNASDVGLGPYKVISHSVNTFSIIKNKTYHNQAPLLNEVTYITKPKISLGLATISLFNDIGGKSIPIRKTYTTGSTFIIFNNKTTNLNNSQRELVKSIVILASKSALKSDLTPCDTAITQYSNDTRLPPKIDISCFYTPEIEQLSEHLRKTFSYFDCDVNIRFSSSRNHTKKNLINSDAYIVNYLNGDHDIVSFIWSILYSATARSVLPMNELIKYRKLLEEKMVKNKHYAIKKIVLKLLIRQGIATPLFQNNFNIELPAHTRFVEITPQAWPDYTTLWLDN